MALFMTTQRMKMCMPSKFEVFLVTMFLSVKEYMFQEPRPESIACIWHWHGAQQWSRRDLRSVRSTHKARHAHCADGILRHGEVI